MSQLPKDRYDDNIKTRNWRLKRTRGTDTKFTLVDKRTGVSIGFDSVLVGGRLGRGDVITLYAGAEEVITSLVEKLDDHIEVASVYQHDVEKEILDAMTCIENTNELPEADYAKHQL